MSNMKSNLKYITEFKKERNQAGDEEKRSVLKIADFAITGVCMLSADTTIPYETKYLNITKNLVNEYKPYQDKLKLKRRIDELEKQMQQVKKAIVDHDASASLYLTQIADMAIRFCIYLMIAEKEV